jgi:hypothetical protein
MALYENNCGGELDGEHLAQMVDWERLLLSPQPNIY